jgi:hypothetical protein
MASAHLSLNNRVQWESVCTILQIPLNSHALPLTTTCPLCAGFNLGLYWDKTSGGAWHHCKSCGSTGDMIDLAGKAWNTTPEVVMSQLCAAGTVTAPELLTTEAVANHQREYPDYRQRMDSLWVQARGNFRYNRCPDIEAICGMYGIFPPEMSPERWNEGPGLFVGAVDHRIIEKAFHPSAGESDDRIRNASENRVFQGGKWKDVLIVPFYDLPGRIRAFAFLGRQGQIPKDLVFRRLTQNPGGSSAVVSEAGLAGVESIDLAGNPDYVIAMDNWPRMLRIQFRHFRSSLRALPIVVWWDDGFSRTRSAWSMLGPRKIVFWTFKLDHRVLLQAIEVDGLISMAGPEQPTPESVSHFLRLHPMELQGAICRQARPWPEALRDWMDRSEEGQTNDLLLHLEQTGADVGYILRRCGRDGLAPISSVARSICFDSIIIKETPEGWIEEKGKRKIARSSICNAMLRITHLIKDKTTGELFCRGEIRYKREVIPFIEAYDEVRDNAAGWLEKHFITHGLGVFTCRKKYRGDLHHIAISFFEPAMVIDDVRKWEERLEEQQPEPARVVVYKPNAVMPALATA